MLRVADITPTGKLVAFLPVLAPALAVRLPGDRPVPALGFSDPARGQDEVDRAECVLHAVRVVFDPPRMKEKARLCRPPPFGGLTNGALGHAGHLRRSRGRPLAAVRRHVLESD